MSAKPAGRTLPAVRSLPWAEIPGEVYAPAAKETAHRVAERLHPLFPSASTMGALFASVWRSLEADKMVAMVLRLNPGIGRMPRNEANRAALRMCIELLGTLFEAALLERGATIEELVGEPSVVLKLGDERVAPGALLGRLRSDPPAARQALGAWAQRLERRDGSPPSLGNEAATATERT